MNTFLSGEKIHGHRCDNMDLDFYSSYAPTLLDREGDPCRVTYYKSGEVYIFKSTERVRTSVDDYNLFEGDLMIVTYEDADNPDESGCQIKIFRNKNKISEVE